MTNTLFSFMGIQQQQPQYKMQEKSCSSNKNAHKNETHETQIENVLIMSAMPLHGAFSDRNVPTDSNTTPAKGAEQAQWHRRNWLSCFRCNCTKTDNRPVYNCVCFRHLFELDNRRTNKNLYAIWRIHSGNWTRTIRQKPKKPPNAKCASIISRTNRANEVGAVFQFVGLMFYSEKKRNTHSNSRCTNINWKTNRFSFLTCFDMFNTKMTR